MKITIKTICFLTLGLNFMEGTQAQQPPCVGNSGSECIAGSYTSNCQYCCMDGGYLYCTCRTNQFDSNSNQLCQNTRLKTSDCGASEITSSPSGPTKGEQGYLQCGSKTGDAAHKMGMFPCKAAPAPYYCGGAY